MKSCDIPEENCEEIATYFVESFGNDTRIDYGTGKLNFFNHFNKF
jgi:hypothetical protein